MKFAKTTVLALLAGTTLLAEAPTPISGDYVEARSNHVYTCPCFYSGEQGTGGKEAILAWNFKTGDFRGTPLAGARAAAVILADRNLAVEGAVRKSVLYLDTAASARQREAVLELFRDYYSAVLGKIVSVRAAEIGFERDRETTTVSIGDTVRLAVRPARLPEDAHPGSVVWYSPFVQLNEPVLGATLHQKFWGADFGHRWWESDAGITGYLGSFSLLPGGETKLGTWR